MGQWVVQLNGRLRDGTDLFVRFAMGAGIAFTDAPYVDGGLIRWQGATQKIVVDQSGVVQSEVDVGEIQIANAPAEIGLAGPYDILPSYLWHHSIAQLYWAPTKVWADAVVIAQGQMQQPVANIAGGSVLRFPLRDPRTQLNRVFQPTKYVGNNALFYPYGVEGDADLKGKPKPILYGTASNIPGVLINAGILIYQLADQPGVVLCARDGAIPLTRGVARSSLVSLQTSIPAQGAYDTYSGTEGLYVKLGSVPKYKVTFDAQEGAAEADRTHAQIWRRISVNRCTRTIGLTPNIDDVAVAAADAIDGHEVGFWWPDETTCKAVVDEVLASFSGYEVKDVVTKKWGIFKLLQPSGLPDLNLVLLEATSALKAIDRPLMKLDRVQPSYLPDGIPAWRVNVQWGKNYTVMSPADVSPIAASRLRDKFATEWRTESDGDDTLIALYFDSAHEMTIPTGYQPGDDGETCPHALAEAVRIRALYTPERASYQASFRPKVTDVVEAGKVFQLTYPMFDLPLGRLFRVMQASDLVENGVRTAIVVLGLQSTDGITADTVAVTVDTILITSDAV